MRILIVAHDFPPLNSSASRRPYSWARAWTDAGHEVHVLTTAKYALDGRADLALDLSGITVHEVAYLRRARAASGAGGASPVPAPSPLFELVRRATRRLRLGLGLFTQTTMLAYPRLARAGLALLASRPFDLIVSTSGPEVCTFVAHRLAGRARLPWLADYRDLWFQEFAVQRYAFTTFATGRLNRRMLRRAAAVSTVSEGLAGYLRRVVACPVWVCYNGFLEPFKGTGDVPALEPGKRHIVYTGNFYPDKRDPAPFCDALARLLQAEPGLRGRLRVDVFGPDEPWVRERFAARGLQDVLAVHGQVGYGTSLAAQRAADLLLFVDWMDDRAEGVLTGKLFEYLASGAPILSVGTRRDSEAARVILDCAAGVVATTADEAAGALAAMVRGELDIAPDRARIAAFSRRGQALALLDRVVRQGLAGRADSPARDAGFAATSEHPPR